MGTPCAHKLLYLINGIVGLAGIAVLAIAIYKIRDKSADVAATPDWAYRIVAIFGGFVVVFTLLGIWGTCRQADHKRRGSCNCILWLYAILLFICFVIQIAMCGVVLVTRKVITSAQAGDYTASGVSALDDRVTGFIDDHGTQFIDVENWIGCCGYNWQNTTLAPPVVYNASDFVSLVDKYGRTTDYASTEYCPNSTGCPVCLGNKFAGNTTEPCRARILSMAKDATLIVGIVALVLGLLQLLALLSTCCIMCCTKYEGHEDSGTQMMVARPRGAVQYA